MEEEKGVINNYEKIKEIGIFILLLICFMLPIFRQFKFTFEYAINNEYNFIKIAGIIGIVYMIIFIVNKYNHTIDKKQYFKEMLPIFIFVVYMLWTLISSILSPNVNNAFNGTEFRKDGYISYIAYAGLFSLALSLKSDKLKKILLNLFVMIAVSTLFFIEIANHGYFEDLFWEKNIVKSVFYNINHHGYYLLIASTITNFLFICEKNKIIKIGYAIIYCYLLYYLVLNDTFGCYLALLGTVIFFIVMSFIKKEKRIVGIISLIIFILVSLFNNMNIYQTSDFKTTNITSSNIKQLSTDIGKITNAKSNPDNNYESAGSGRIQIWIYGIRFFMEKPIFGYGPENLETKYAENGIVQDRPHNIVIQQLTTSGLPGCLLYFAALGIIFIRGIRKLDMKNTILVVCLFTSVSYMISAMFGNSMYYTSPYFFIILGFLMSKIMDTKNKKGY